MATPKPGISKMYANIASQMMAADVAKKDGSEQKTGLSFDPNPSAFPALSADTRATALFTACSEAFTWGSKNPSSLDENPPSIQGDWDSAETELIRASALSGRFTKNASASGQLTADQQGSYSNMYGVALAQGLSDALGKKPEDKAYTSGTAWPEGLEANFQAIYTAAYWVYGSPEYSGSGENGGTGSDQETASNLGRNLLIGVLLAGAAAAGLYWYSTTQKKAKANPSDMKLYQLNDEQESITLDEFLSDNSELDPEDVEKIKSLGVEETFHSGGGAQPEWKIRRVY